LNIWEKTTVDVKGKCVIPKTIRDYVGIRPGHKILWVAANKEKKKSAEEINLKIIVIDKKER